jgi:hypothetical protein
MGHQPPVLGPGVAQWVLKTAARIPDYLEPLIQEVVTRVLAGVTQVIAQHLPDANAPALLDRNGLARALGVSLTSLDRLKHVGMPTVRVLDSPRFDLADVVKWLKSRPEE